MAFTKLEGDTAIIQSGGVYKQVDLYEWNGGLYAAVTGGYVRLKENGSTSKDGIGIVEIQTDAALYRDRFGRLATADGTGRSALTGSEAILQIGNE